MKKKVTHIFTEIGLPAPVDLTASCFPAIYSDAVNHHDFAAVSHSPDNALGVTSPINGELLTHFQPATSEQLNTQIAKANQAFLDWREIPAPKRGDLVRVLGNQFRKHQQPLAELITLECGKILQESLGEVQEVIDICDFAQGLSRQLHGLTITSERPHHRMMEQWHPLGTVGIITAFNFPMAVWAWNAALALVCGNTLVWKPSEKTPLCAIACQKMLNDALQDFIGFPKPLSSVVIGGSAIGQVLAGHCDVPLISATGSVAMGQKVSQTVAARLGRSLLELGGNNAMVITPSANLELALRAILFSAVGTCGQRCTTLRRLILHKSVENRLTKRLINAYETIAIGNPLNSHTLVGPLIDEDAYLQMQRALENAQKQGGKLLYGGDAVKQKVPGGGYYVQPALIKIDAGAPILQQETFAPVLYLTTYNELDEAIVIHNDVPQGLSSAIFTADVREAEWFMSATGSDCGIANVNIGTSGAEIGGAFGGEKETGGGRESGSDAWKSYMRRATNTINYGMDIPLSQGIKFD